MTVTPERIVAASCYVHKIPPGDFYEIVPGRGSNNTAAIARTIACYLIRTRLKERSKKGELRSITFATIANIIGWKSESGAWLAFQTAKMWRDKKDDHFLKARTIWLLSASDTETLPRVAEPKMKAIRTLAIAEKAIDCEECNGMGNFPYPHGPPCDQCRGHGRYRPWVNSITWVRA